MTRDAVGRELAAQGKVAWLTTIGRRSGQPRNVAVGFVDQPDGSILVAATGIRVDWAANLLAEPRLTVEIADRRFTAIAEELEQPDHGRAVAALILRYGTPSEGLGHGHSFRLRPATLAEATDPVSGGPG
jgi:deazaflavin-dependent oxidoreductase (nitroreductase family)